MKVLAGATHTLTRAHNLHLALELIRTRGPVSRAEIARETGMSKPTASRLLEELLQHGLVRGSARGRGVGHPAVYFTLSPEAVHLAGVEIGPAGSRAVLAGFDGSVRLTETLPADPARPADPAAECELLLDRLLARAGLDRSRLYLTVVGLSCAAQLGEPLEDRLGVPTVVLRGSQLGALGEYEQYEHGAAGRRVDHLAYVRASEPGGVGLVLNGRLHRGARPALLTTTRYSTEEVAGRLADCLTPITLSTDIELIVLGCDAGPDDRALLESLRLELRERLADPPPVVRSGLGELAPVTGAVRLGLRSATRDLVTAITGGVQALGWTS
ncbi:helix-turn-helix domain-containing protein [Kitasatospora sp. NPDC093102]|uniref:ROK family transcriptional regulator n=1 Tax=Kitasatospora sp. NPDC093102 TaxID=3155069 RepID=UPI003432AD31